MSDSKYVSLGNNTILFAIGTFGSRAISFFMLPVFTRVLSQAEFGTIDLVITSVSLLLPLLTMNMTQAVFRFTLTDTTFERKQSVFTSALVLCVLGFLALGAFYKPLEVVLGSSHILVFFYLLFFVEIIHGLAKTIIRAEKRLRLFAVSDIVQTFTFVLAGILLVAVLKKGIIGYLIAQITAFSVSLLLIWLVGSVRSYVKISQISRRIMKEMLKYALPLAPTALSWWIISASDRYILTLLVGIQATGIYSVAYRFPSLISVFSNVFYQAWQISSIEEYGGNEDYRNAFYSKVFKYYYTFMFLFSSALALVLKPMISVMVGGSFVEAVLYVPVLIVGVSFHAFSNFYGVCYHASKRTLGALSTTLLGAILNIVLNFLLIPFIGIQGAAISTASAYFLTWILRIIETRKYQKIEVDWWNFLSCAILSSVSLISILFMSNAFPLQIALLVGIATLQRREIRAIVKLLTTRLSTLKKKK